jgi:hypothetical protein
MLVSGRRRLRAGAHSPLGALIWDALWHCQEWSANGAIGVVQVIEFAGFFPQDTPTPDVEKRPGRCWQPPRSGRCEPPMIKRIGNAQRHRTYPMGDRSQERKGQGEGCDNAISRG